MLLLLQKMNEAVPVSPEGETSPSAQPVKPRKRTSTAAALGASPKAKSQRNLTTWVKKTDPPAPVKVDPPTPLTADEVLNPSKPVLRENQPKSTSAGDFEEVDGGF